MQSISREFRSSGIEINRIEQVSGIWQISAAAAEAGVCPACHVRSSHRHGHYWRKLQDLPIHGSEVTVNVRLTRWRCGNSQCRRKTYADQVCPLAPSHARRTRRVASLVQMIGHGAGGLPGQRLLQRLSMPVSDDTILRQLKRSAKSRDGATNLHAVGIDDWAWRKGSSYGTIMVDLERRQVVDVLEDRSADGTANWLRQHPNVAFIGRDRCGLYAQGGRDGAPQARQVADRFHLIQNLRQAIEAQLNRTSMATSRPVLPRPGDCAEDDFTRPSGPQGQQGLAEHHHIIRDARLRSRRDTHQRIQSLRDARKPLSFIAQEVGLDRRTVGKWLEATAPPTRRPKALAPGSPNYFHEYLARRWSEGRVRGRDLFDEIKLQGYAGSYSHLERLLSTWRTVTSVAPEHLRTAETHRLVDPATGNGIAPNIAAILCMKPRGQMNAKQMAKVDAMKAASSEFAAMRRFAMRFRGLFRSGNTSALDDWLTDVGQSGIYALQRFARTIKRDIAAVYNAMTTIWSNGQTEGQINRLKTLKRAMYGRAGIELLRARMLPLQNRFHHTD
jgi:transposase